MTKIGSLLHRIASLNREEEEKATKRELGEEVAAPSPFSVRQPWMSEEIASTLTPKRLAALITDIKTGDAFSYLTLAEEMEERDGHYRAVLGSRKYAISSLEYLIEAGGDDEKARKIADDVRLTIIRNPKFETLVSDLLDALGKGYSVCEIVWDTGPSKWVPKSYAWRDPRWFRYDYETGKRLMLKEGADLVPLKRNKFILHEPHLKSGLQIRAGLALPCAYYHMVKSYDLAGWAAFAQTYGYPIRFGKYGRNASKHDVEILKAAVRNIGTDVGAVIPENMVVEVVNAATGTGNVNLYEKLASYADKQISKTVLGQTMSTDAEGGQYKGELHNEIRLEIRESDAGQLAETINRDLIIPYVQLNYGIQASYPHLTIPVPRPEDIPGLVGAVKELVPLGLRVKTEDMYYKLGLNEPGKGDDILVPPQAETGQPERNRMQTALSLNAETAAEKDPVDELADEASGDWEEMVGPFMTRLQALVNACTGYDELRARLPELLKGYDSVAVDRIALAAFKAKAMGDADAFLEDADV